MDAIYPKLKDGGTVWVNLGDTYNTKSGNMVQKEYSNTINTCMNNGVIDKDVYTKAKDVKNKTLLLIPHRFAIGCIDRGWIIRNDIIWAKRNGMPESVTDRFSKKHEYFFFMVKNEKYYFDLDSIRDKVIVPANGRSFGNNQSNGKKIRGEWKPKNQDLGKNPGSVSDFWDIPTKPSKVKHYASYNETLITKPILAGCPEGGIIYDPFMGTGSTAEAAIKHGRKFIGSEMSKEYCEIAEKRLQPLLAQQTLFI